MKKSQAGFTLIELIIVAIILGILATVAVPIYLDMRTQAATSNVQAVAAALGSGSAINYSGSLAGASGVIGVNSCTTASGGVGALLTGGTMPLAPSGGTYSFAGVSGSTATTGAVAAKASSGQCVLYLTGVLSSAVTATFTVMATQ